MLLQENVFAGVFAFGPDIDDHVNILKGNNDQ
jgi:hypothetical protein